MNKNRWTATFSDITTTLTPDYPEDETVSTTEPQMTTTFDSLNHSYSSPTEVTDEVTTASETTVVTTTTTPTATTTMTKTESDPTAESKLVLPSPAPADKTSRYTWAHLEDFKINLD